jgi:type IV secretory pathway VirB10-like protein
MRQAQTYQPPEPLLPKQVEATPDPLAGLNAKLAQLLAELEALKKRPTGTTVIQPGQQQTGKTTPPAKQSASMLFVEHQLTEPEAPKSTIPEYSLAPGATKIQCIVETAINSNVEGSFTAKVSTNVYDTRPRDAICWCPRGVRCSGMIKASRSCTAMNGCPRSA